MRVCHGLMTHPLILCSFLKGKEAYSSSFIGSASPSVPSHGHGLPRIQRLGMGIYYGLTYSSFASNLRSPKGANVNNRGWNDRRSWNLRTN